LKCDDSKSDVSNAKQINFRLECRHTKNQKTEKKKPEKEWSGSKKEKFEISSKTKFAWAQKKRKISLDNSFNVTWSQMRIGHLLVSDDLIESPHVNKVEQLREKLNRQSRVDATFA
jgi:hypothetical protein